MFRNMKLSAKIGAGFAALLLGLAALYVVIRFGQRIGTEQLSRLVVVAGAVLLSVLTVRASVRAAYIDYDYATEYLVYAHGAPAVKTVMEMVDEIATISTRLAAIAPFRALTDPPPGTGVGAATASSTPA